MKHLLILLLLIGYSIDSIAQNYAYNSNERNEFVKRTSKTPKLVNAIYMDKTSNSLTPKSAKYLQNIVAKYNVLSNPNFDGRKDKLFKIEFKSNHGSINASFNNTGKLIYTIETYKNVILPLKIRNHVLKQHSTWLVKESNFIVHYYKNKTTANYYKVIIEKEGEIKILKLDI